MRVVIGSHRFRTLLVGLVASALLAWFSLGPKHDAMEPAALSYVHFKLASDATPEQVTAELGLGTMATVEPLFTRSAHALAEDRALAIAQSGEKVPDLSRWYRVLVAGHATHMAKQLEAMPAVVTAFPEPTFALANVHAAEAKPTCPIKTPSYEPYQGYLARAPGGINAPAAWSRPGGTGEHVWVADVEGGWNHKHEDLPTERMVHAGGSRMRGEWRAHGTAVLGEIAAKDNGIGMVGIAPDVGRIVTASIGRIGVPAALDRAQAKLRPGDVLIVELQTVGPRGRYAPVEYWDDIYDVLSVATARGIIVVEAAGNGGEDLDHEAYEGRFDREQRDSGAIMVGAGAPLAPGYTDGSRLDFSNYGSRLDVQGWGREVATLDYGDLQNCATVDRKYTARFAGTSSATPVVAGAAMLLQSIRKADGRSPLSSTQMRTLLRETGTPQTDGPNGPASEHIGPRPDLARALGREGL